MSATLESLAVEYVRARASLLDAKQRRNEATCEVVGAGWRSAERDDGQRPCRWSGKPLETWCRGCQLSRERHQEVLAEQRRAAGLWTRVARKLRSEGNHSKKSSSCPGGDHRDVVRAAFDRIDQAIGEAGHGFDVLGAARAERSEP